MEDQITRKQFLRHMFTKSIRLSAELIDAFQPPSNKRPAPEEYDFVADLPPELLVAEAERLGLAPDDKAAILAAIAQKMQQIKA